MWEYASDGMTYDDETHTYTLDGGNLTSVTTLLKDVDIINNKFYTEAGANNGKRRHLKEKSWNFIIISNHVREKW